MGTLVTLPNLYTSAADIVALLGSEGVDLSLDDHNMATGQKIEVTAPAPIGSITINITALSAPLLAGSVLQFDGAGLSNILVVTLTSTGLVGDTSLLIAPLAVAMPALAFAEDSGVTTYLAGLLVRGASYATAWVKRYCCNRYSDSDLATAWSVNEWATTYAARWVCQRRRQGCSKGLQKDFERMEKEIKQVQYGNLHIEDIGTRTSGWPFFSNTTLDLLYTIQKVRVEPQISEGTPTQYPQLTDWQAMFRIEI
jgi:hypothetical protein